MKWYWWVVIAVVLVAGGIYWYQRRRSTQAIEKIEEAVKENKTLFTEADAKAALAKVKQVYGADMAKQIEKIARLETAHFTSKQYKLTGTGGMEAHGNAPYYGWFAPFFIKNPEYTPVGTTDMLEGAGLSTQGGTAQSSKPKVFVIMPSVEAFMMFLADYALRYPNEGGLLRWYSTNKTAQATYANSLKGISTPIVNSLA